MKQASQANTLTSGSHNGIQPGGHLVNQGNLNEGEVATEVAYLQIKYATSSSNFARGYAASPFQ